MKLACERFVRDLAQDFAGWRWTYNADKADTVCSLIELFPHEKGELQGEPVKLGDWQCFIFCNVFGWVSRETGFRRFREALVLIPRGNGKSPMGAWTANYMAWFDGEKGSEVYCAATTQEQALEVFRPAKAVVEMMGLNDRLGIVVPKGEMGVLMYQPATRSRLRAVIGKPKDGKSPHCVINDEYHQQSSPALYESFKRGLNKRKQPLMFNISTAGDTVEGPCYHMCEQVTKMLEGEFENERLFGIIYDVDTDEDWTTERANRMANPNFGVSMDPEAMMTDTAEAARDSTKQNEFRCKNQNCWVQATTGWMNMTSFKLCALPLGVKDIDFEEHACYHGSDLASTLDLSATVKVFVRSREEDGRPIYTAFCKPYLPKKQVFNPSRQYLQGWAHDGFLTATEGNAIDYKRIENDTVADIEKFDVRKLCFDQRYAGQYAQQVVERTGVESMVIPPSASEISPAMVELEGAVADGRFEYDGNPVFTWCMANVLARRNQVTGNYHMPDKDRPEKKIDVAVALFIAMAQARFCIQESGFIDPNVFVI